MVIAAAGTLVASVLIPLTPGGTSFLGVLSEAFARDVSEGFLFLLSFGGPYLFGLSVLAAAVLGGGSFARQLLQSAVALFQAQLVLFAARAWMADFGIMPIALLGFSLISAVYLMYYSARSAAEGTRSSGPSVRWLAQWGALLVIGLGAWLRLQLAIGLRLGPAVEMAIGAALLLFLATRRRR
jgi:hypothetical protein